MTSTQQRTAPSVDGNADEGDLDDVAMHSAGDEPEPDPNATSDQGDPPVAGDDTLDARGGLRARVKRSRSWLPRTFAIAVPLVAAILAGVAGYLKWQDGVARTTQETGNQAVVAAKDIVPAMLSYKPDTVDQDLAAPRTRMTGAFKDSYAKLIIDIVAPGAKRGKISAVATVPAAALVSANDHSAEVLVFVDQTTTVDTGPPTNTASSVKVSLQKIGKQWFLSGFVPI